MRLTMNRRARRAILEAGGVLTVEARSNTRCWCAAHLQATVGEPDDPSTFASEVRDGIRVFTRGVIEERDGNLRPASSVVPKTVRIRQRHGVLSAHVG
jgi:hypothetical protein